MFSPADLFLSAAMMWYPETHIALISVPERKIEVLY